MATGFDWAGLAASSAASVLGNVLGSKSANKGAKKSSKAIEKAAKAAAAERERGRVAALGLIGGRMDDSAPRGRIATAMTDRPEVLTPGQQIALEDVSRGVTNNLAASGMRGAGRGGLAVLNDAQRRFRAQAYDQNQARSDQAAQMLFQDAKDAVGTGVNIETGNATANANDVTNAGSGVAANLANIGQTTGDMYTANAKQLGSTIGAIQSLIAQNRKYDKDYPTYKTVP